MKKFFRALCTIVVEIIELPVNVLCILLALLYAIYGKIRYSEPIMEFLAYYMETMYEVFSLKLTWIITGKID